MEWNLHECFDFKNHLMKKYIFILLISVTAVTACKSKKNTASSSASASSSSSSTASIVAASAGNTTGKVSHKYRSTGCATVIVFSQDGNEMTLIPKDKLTSEFDVDGLEIRFNYHSLKMPNPAGCNVGMPAEITDISKK
jgi:hypothetical protein